MFGVIPDLFGSVEDTAYICGSVGGCVELLFDGEFLIVGELAAITAQKLYAVILCGVVGGTDDYAAVSFECLDRVANAWRGDNSG